MRRELTHVNGYFEVNMWVTILAYLSGEFENHFRMTRETCQLLTQEIMHAHLVDSNWQFIWAARNYPTWVIILICLLDQAYEAPFAHIKMKRQRWPEMLLILGKFGTQYVTRAPKLLHSYCGAHLVESYCQESNISDTNLPSYLFSSSLIKIRLSVWHHHWSSLHILKNLNIFGTKRYLNIVNSIFLLTQATFLCFKMAAIGKMG